MTIHKLGDRELNFFELQQLAEYVVTFERSYGPYLRNKTRAGRHVRIKQALNRAIVRARTEREQGDTAQC